MELNDFNELIRDGFISHPDDEAMAEKYHNLCDKLETEGKSQAEAIIIANRLIV